MLAPMERNPDRYVLFDLATQAYFWAPVRFLYLMRLFDLPRAVLLESLLQAATVVLEVPSGYLSDRVGRVTTLRLAAAGFAGASALMALGERLEVLALAQVLLALGFSFRSGTDVSLHLGSLAALGRGHEFALREERLQVRRLVVTATAALLGGLVGLVSLRAVFGLSTLAGLAALGAALGLEEPPEDRADAAQGFPAQLRACAGLLRDRALAWGVAAAVLAAVLDHLPYNFYQPYLELLTAGRSPAVTMSSPALAGLHVFVTMLLGAWMARAAGPLARRLGLGPLVLGVLALELGMTALMGTLLHPAVLALVLLREGPNALTRAPWNAAVVPRLPPARRATFLSLQALAGRVAIAALLASLASGVGSGGDWPTLSGMLRAGAGVGLVAWLGLALTAGAAPAGTASASASAAEPPVVEEAPLDGDEARHLIARLDAELRRQYPDEADQHFRLDPAEVGPGRGAFLVVRVAGRAVGCGAVRRLSDGTAEIKRMFVDPAARGRGVGRALLAALEQRARGLGATRLVLETGRRQAAALALYQRAGFRPIEAFGEYQGGAQSVCLGKPLGG